MPHRVSAAGATAEYHKIWIEQCEAAEQIEGEFGPQQALDYLIGDKFLNFLEAAETDAAFRAEIPAFPARIREIFEQWRCGHSVDLKRVFHSHENSKEPLLIEIHATVTDGVRRCLRLFKSLLLREMFDSTNLRVDLLDFCDNQLRQLQRCLIPKRVTQ